MACEFSAAMRLLACNPELMRICTCADLDASQLEAGGAALASV
jgi:hypothetical protein